MPQPHYIICAESHALDRSTGLLSLFHILEGFTQINTGPRSGEKREELLRNASSSAGVKFVGVAVWRRDGEEESETEFEYQSAARFPGGEERLLTEGPFVFEKQFHRFINGFLMPDTWQGSGEFVFTSRIRPAGASDEGWLSQSFVMPIKVVDKNE